MLELFVVLTLSITVSILLTSVLSVVIILNTNVMKWYMKKMRKITEEIIEQSLEDF